MSNKYPFKLQPLPWDKTTLKSFLSSEAITAHYNLHHAQYVTKMNQLAKEYPELQDLSLAEIVNRYSNTIQNMAAQILNHDFFWNTLSPSGGNPKGGLYKLIVEQFGSYDKFVLDFNNKVNNFFGSGWVWLVFDPQTSFLMIVDGPNAYSPIMNGYIPLLVIDVWEHSYYLDYKSDKKSYVENFWKFINWNRIEKIAREQIFGEDYDIVT